MPHPVYYISLFAENCAFEVIVNGLCVIRKQRINGLNINYPLNTELIGEKNQVKIIVNPVILKTGLPSTFDQVVLKGTIKKYRSNEIVCPEGGELLSTVDFGTVKQSKQAALPTVPDLQLLFPLISEHTFDSQGPSFRNRLIDSAVIGDEKLLLDFAESVREAVKRRDFNGIYAEYWPKVHDYQIAYPDDAIPDPKEDMRQFFIQDFFPGGPITDFKREDIGLRKWCDGRVWEIFRKPNEEFLANKGIDGDINKIEVYVSMVDNQIKIIR